MKKSQKGNTKKINFTKDSEKLAEFYGIMLGDGNSNRVKDYKIGTYVIRIVGDSKFDRDYLVNYVKPLVEGLFKIKAKIRKFKSKRAMSIEIDLIQML